MNMDKFFYPHSIVIFGLSDSPGNLSIYILENLGRFGFTGRVYGIGRKEKDVMGTKVYSKIEDVPEVPDLAVFVIPAAAMPDALRSCKIKGVTHVIIETGGFSELGAKGKALEDQIRSIAEESGITCIGPNCVGVINKENGLVTPFIPFEKGEVGKGHNSFITQSGGLIHDLLHRCAADNVGISKFASIGNKLMVNESDILEYFIHDPDSKCIGLYLEDIREGRRLVSLAAGTDKPVIMLKGNASPLSREIASFHTAALVGDSAVADSAFKQAGIHHVRSPQDMVDCFKIFDLPPLKGPNIVIIGRSGGQGVLLADEAHSQGFILPKLPPEFFVPIGKKAKAGVMRNTNPVDLGDVWDEHFFLTVVEMALGLDNADGVVFYFEYGNNHDVSFDVLKGVERLCREYDKPVALCMVPDRSVWFSLRYSSPFPFFTEAERAFTALKRSLWHYERISGHRKTGIIASAGFNRATEGKAEIMPAGQSLSLLAKYSLPAGEYELFADYASGLAAANRIGYPVALKKTEPFILHKTEEGAVKLNIKNELELSAAIKKMNGTSYLLQKMAPEGIDAIIGGKQDPEFGHVILFGLGGIFVEIFRDTSVRIAPVDMQTAKEMIDEIKGAPLLKGARGTAMADIASLTDAIVNVSRLLSEHPEITNLDINPLRVFPEGRGCAALDVKIGYCRIKE
ncbi:MAG: acetate--CoA ligase family protein [Spirochaetota bacterium]